MSFAVFEGACQLNANFGKPIISASGFQAQAYVYRFFLDFPPYGVQNPPTARDRIATFREDSARWPLSRYNDFIVADLGTAMLFVKSNNHRINDLTSRFTIRFSIHQERQDGSPHACLLSGRLYSSDPAKPVQDGVWQQLPIDVPYGQDAVGSFDANIPFIVT